MARYNECPTMSSVRPSRLTMWKSSSGSVASSRNSDKSSETLNSVDGVAEVLHAASEVENEDEFGVNLVDVPIGKPRTLVVEGFHECPKLW